jgi:hypothetical protein
VGVGKYRFLEGPPPFFSAPLHLQLVA